MFWNKYNKNIPDIKTNILSMIIPAEIYSANYWYSPKDKDTHLFLKNSLMNLTETYEDIESQLCKNVFTEYDLHYKSIGYMNHIYENLSSLNLMKNSFSNLISRIYGLDGKKKISKRTFQSFHLYKKSYLDYIQEDLDDEKKIFMLTNKKQMEDVISKVYENVRISYNTLGSTIL